MSLKAPALCAGAESNSGDRVLGEAGEASSIALLCQTKEDFYL